MPPWEPKLPKTVEDALGVTARQLDASLSLTLPSSLPEASTPVTLPEKPPASQRPRNRTETF